MTLVIAQYGQGGPDVMRAKDHEVGAPAATQVTIEQKAVLSQHACSHVCLREEETGILRRATFSTPIAIAAVRCETLSARARDNIR